MSEENIVVVGGGIAGVTCVDYLCHLNSTVKVILITASPLIKTVTSIVPLSKTVFRYDVSEKDSKFLQDKHLNLEIVYDTLKYIDSEHQFVLTNKNLKLSYKFLCLCTGGIPKIIKEAENIDRIYGIRDTDSVQSLMERLKDCRKIVVVGNGGIASELVFALKNIHIVWVIKDKHMSSTFVDPGAAEFLHSSNSFRSNPENVTKSCSIKRMRYTEEQVNVPQTTQRAAALGPDWLKNNEISGGGQYCLDIIYQCHINAIKRNEDEWPLQVTFSNGSKVDCDLLVSATGVTPSVNFSCDKEFDLGPDGGLSVNWRMLTSLDNIFAAGDVAFANWSHSDHWHQMRLWSQAYQMGAMAAKSMHAYCIQDDSILQDFCFELFTHTTKLFGYQIILLGKYNGQGLGSNYEILIRTTPNMEYIKFVLVDNKLQGAILIGETGLEETCENLILNQIDLSPYGDDILNPDIDIEDYFD